MNEHLAFLRTRAATQAAEGAPRWRWTVAEVERMVAHGFFSESDRFELVGGEIVPISPAERRHETIKIELAQRLCDLAAVRRAFTVAQEPQFNLAPDTYVNPDILVHRRGVKTFDLKGPDALLVVEVAETSLNYDLTIKLPIYALHGVRECWVINAITRMTSVLRRPIGNDYADRTEVAPVERLVPSLAPELAVSLGELDLD